MILIKINKDTVEQLNDAVCSESLIFFPEEYFECKSTEIKNIFEIKNSRLETPVDHGFINKYTTVLSIDENIINSDVLIPEKAVKGFLRRFSRIRYIIIDIEDRRTKVLNENSYYTISEKPLYGIVINEVKREYKKETFSEKQKITNPNLKKALTWAEDKINDVRKNKSKDSFDLQLDLILNTMIDYSKKISKCAEEKSKDFINNIPNCEEIQKKSEKYFDKISNDITKTINNVKDKVDSSLKTESLTLDEIVKHLGNPVWFEIIKDIEKTVIKGTCGWGTIRLEDGKLQLVANDFNIDFLTNFDSVKIYKDEISKIINDIYNNTDDSPIKKQVDFIKEEFDKIINKTNDENITLEKDNCIEECELPSVDLDSILLLSKRCNVGLKEAKDALEKTNYILEDAEKYLETKNND